MATDCTIECLCPRATHRHGTGTMYVIHQCRGDACREAARIYESNHHTQGRYGIEADHVDAEQARKHIASLRAAGIGTRQISELSGVSRGVIANLVVGSREKGHDPYGRVSAETSRRILAVIPAEVNLAGAESVDATGTHRRIQALACLGYSRSRLGVDLGITPSTMSAMMSRSKIQAATARKVSELYEELWDQPYSPTGWREHTAASRTRNLAQSNGWLPPMAWDDELIDNPDFTPATASKPTGSKVEARHQAFFEEVQHLAGFGFSLEHIAQRLNMTPGAFERQMHRLGQHELLAKPQGHKPEIFRSA